MKELTIRQFEILKYIHKQNKFISMDEIKLFFAKNSGDEIENDIFWLNANNCINVEYSKVDENGNLCGSVSVIITDKGRRYIEESSERHSSERFTRITAVIGIILTIIVIYFSAK